MTEPTVQISEATSAKAQKLFSFLIAMTDTPGEAYAIIVSMMVNLWLVGAQNDNDLDGLLASFSNSLRTNVDMARTNDRRTAN